MEEGLQAMYRGAVISLMLVACVETSVPRAMAQTILLKPNWNDAAAENYLRQRNSGEFASELPSDRSPGDAEFSLPVLGLGTGFTEAAPIDSARNRFISDAPANLPWPSCASDRPEEAVARDKTGTWYTVNYDFGCIHVSINGDRNAEPGSADEAPVPDGEAMPEVVDEEGDADLVSQLSIVVNRFGLPYLVSIECNAEIKAFCQNPAAWPALISRLSILDGQP